MIDYTPTHGMASVLNRALAISRASNSDAACSEAIQALLTYVACECDPEDAQEFISTIIDARGWYLE